MVIIKTPQEIALLRTAGGKLARILAEASRTVAPGVTTAAIEARIRTLIVDAGCTPALLHYKPEGARTPYPAATCISVNAVVVHGIPNEYVLTDGDIVSLDLVVGYQGVFVDQTITVPVGTISIKDKELLAVTEGALYEGIHAIAPGGRVGDISYAIQQYVQKHHLGIVRGLAGHGVGRYIHEDPYIPNYGKKGKGEHLVPGMVIAIEPMISWGSEQVVELADGYSLKTSDNSRAAHFEHTVLITESGAEILTIEK